MSRTLNDMFSELFGGLYSDMMNNNEPQYPKIEIQFRKKEFEDTLNEMWSNYGTGNVAQLPEYQKQVKIIKEAGCKVLRNSAGKHKIII
ncbi:MAG: hypothetical protein LIP12_00060 [Clostridiales bacterium]|nr:hypothetical protein [Clostridiales bacterium]